MPYIHELTNFTSGEVPSDSKIPLSISGETFRVDKDVFLSGLSVGAGDTYLYDLLDVDLSGSGDGSFLTMNSTGEWNIPSSLKYTFRAGGNGSDVLSLSGSLRSQIFELRGSGVGMTQPSRLNMLWDSTNQSFDFVTSGQLLKKSIFFRNSSNGVILNIDADYNSVELFGNSSNAYSNVLFLKNTTYNTGLFVSEPGGGSLTVKDGSLYYLGSDGTFTKIAPA
jgi:hypothetical protein